MDLKSVKFMGVAVSLAFLFFLIFPCHTFAGRQGQIVILYFYSNACDSCTEAERFIDDVIGPFNADLKQIEKKVIVKKYNILKDNNLDFVEKYFHAYSVAEKDQVYPIVFIGRRYLSGSDNIINGLKNEVFSKNYTGTAEIKRGPNGVEVLNRFEGLRPAGVFLIGLVNGVGPCSLSLMLLFLSLLMVKKVNLFKVGLCFCLGKFIAYFLLGTVFFTTLSEINTSWINKLVKSLAIFMVAVIAALNIKDFFEARRERYGRIIMQLPASIRKINHKWIGKISGLQNVKQLFWVSLALGAFTSVGEFLCTGQIYLATIVTVLKTNRTLNKEALAYFIIYDFAFIIPLILLCFLVYKGREIFEVSEYIRGKLPLIKLVNAVAFMAIGILILFLY